MGERLGIEVIHLDQLFWHPGWEPTPSERWRAIQTRLVAGDRWIMDGNYGNSMDVRVVAADTVVFVDLPRRTTLTRAARRWWRHRDHEVHAFGCPERMHCVFFWCMWGFPRDSGPRLFFTVAANT